MATWCLVAKAIFSHSSGQQRAGCPSLSLEHALPVGLPWPIVRLPWVVLLVVHAHTHTQAQLASMLCKDYGTAFTLENFHFGLNVNVTNKVADWEYLCTGHWLSHCHPKRNILCFPPKTVQKYIPSLVATPSKHWPPNNLSKTRNEWLHSGLCVYLRFHSCLWLKFKWII